MLSLSTFRDAEYPLSTVAADAESYYLGHGEVPGRWLGSAAGVFGLAGQVDADDFRAIIDGRDPNTGELLAAANRRVGGFDLTFRAPKSVSVLFGLGDDETARIVAECHERAVNAAIGYVERQAAWTRRGHNGVAHEQTPALVAAAFRHRTSRKGDPHLHTHVMVANMVRSSAGRWATLHGQVLYAHAKTAGCLYEAELRLRLTQRLGVEWGPVTNGIADIEGVPEAFMDLFSKRRRQIEAQLDDLGYSSPKAAEIAALDTRPSKEPTASPGRLRDRWLLEAHKADLDLPVDEILHRHEPTTPSIDHLQEVQEVLAGPVGMTEHASTFDRRDVIIGWTNQLQDGASAELVEALADQLLARPDTVSLVSSQLPGPANRDTGRHRHAGKAKAGVYSTRELLEIERRIVADAQARQDGTVGIVNETHLAAALARRPSLSQEQARMVATLTTSGAGIELVSAPAGTGKTFCLDAARDAWEGAGYRVVGAALAARASAQLEASAAIPSATLASLLLDLDREPLPENSVVVVDEAAMVDSRTLARLLDHARRAGAKVVLAGDPKQLPEIGAGGAFGGLQARIGTTTLSENRRQVEHWEQTALAELRDGDLDRALGAYKEHGRIVTADTADAVVSRLSADWWAATVAGENALMIAARWVDVEDLNHLARTRMRHSGELTGPELEAADRAFQTGDRVLALRNDKQHHLQNGALGTVTAVDPNSRELTVRTDTGEVSHVSARYLDAGHLAHGYATTAHKAQGLTCDRALLLGNDTLYRELGYVAMSRGRLGNHLYIVGTDPNRDLEIHRDDRDALDVVTDALGRSGAQTMAIDTNPSPQTVDLGALLRERRALDRVLRDRPADPADIRLAIEEQRSSAGRRLFEAENQVIRLGPPRLRDRLGRPDPARTLANNRVHHAEETVARLDNEFDKLDSHVQNRHRFDTAHADELARRADLDSIIESHMARHLRQIGQHPPQHLERALGPIPDDRTRSKQWWRLAHTVESYRLEANVIDGDLLGPPTKDPDLRRAYQGIEVQIQLGQLQLQPRSMERSGPDHGLDLAL